MTEALEEEAGLSVVSANLDARDLYYQQLAMSLRCSALSLGLDCLPTRQLQLIVAVLLQAQRNRPQHSSFNLSAGPPSCFLSSKRHAIQAVLRGPDIGAE
jgi:hypothetical protein